MTYTDQRLIGAVLILAAVTFIAYDLWRAARIDAAMRRHPAGKREHDYDAEWAQVVREFGEGA